MRNTTRLSMLSIVAALVLFTACGSGDSQSAAAGADSASSDGDPVAIVNGREVPRSLFERQLQQQLQAYQAQGMEIDDEQMELFEQQLVDQLIARELVLQDGESRGIAPSDEDIQAELDDIRAQFPDEDGFEEALEQQNLTLEEIERNIAEQFVIEEILESDVLANTGVDETSAREFYEDNPEFFETPDQVRASHILILTQGASDEERAEARETIETVLSELEAGESFEALAREYSEDGTAEEGGDLGFFGAGEMVPEFEQAAFNLDVGETSGIVETQFGYHIVRITDRREAGTQSFEEARPQIEQFLGQEQQQNAFEEYIESLREEAEVEILL
ncbi:MAG: peptidylprolyl isomerase [Spirochaetaceae bacterium]